MPTVQPSGASAVQPRDWSNFARLLTHIQSPKLLSIALNWKEFGGGVRIPAWRDVDPIVLKECLPILWSWKYDAASDSFTGRLSGEDIVRAHGKSLRGAALRDFFAKNVVDMIHQRYRKIVTEATIAHGVGRVHVYSGGNGIGERIILPLSDDGVTCDGILGATTYRLDESAPEHHGKPAPFESEEVDFYPL